MRLTRTTFQLLLLLIAGSASPAWAGLINASVTGYVFTADIDHSGGVDGELTVSFETCSELSTSSIGATSELMTSTEVLAVESRLPSTSVSVPSSYEVLLTIDPPTTGGLSFEEVVTIEVYTNDLTYTTGTTLRLFAAPLNGDFVDITESVDGGSYRVGGSKGDFSEFVIADDGRANDTVIVTKIGRLDDKLAVHEADIDSTVYATLDGLVADVDSKYDAGNVTGAISDLDTFITKVKNNAGPNIPDEWRATRDVDNVAGMLRAIADTLRFSLVLETD